jgi:hypothetical protein
LSDPVHAAVSRPAQAVGKAKVALIWLSQNGMAVLPSRAGIVG